MFQFYSSRESLLKCEIIPILFPFARCHVSERIFLILVEIDIIKVILSAEEGINGRIDDINFGRAAILVDLYPVVIV